MSAKRVLIGLAIGAVALVAGTVSYMHVYTLSLALHQPPLVACLMPIGVDGLVVVGSVILLDGNRLGWLGIGPGVAISVFANAMSGLAFGWLSATWAGIPALSFALACFIFERWLKAQGKAVDAADAVPDAPSAPSASVPDTSVPDASDSAVPDAGYASGATVSTAGTDAPKSLTPRTHYRDLLAKGELPSVRAVQRDFRVGAPRARTIRDDLEKYVRPQLIAA
jgi:hypothetical protein